MSWTGAMIVGWGLLWLVWSVWLVSLVLCGWGLAPCTDGNNEWKWVQGGKASWTWGCDEWVEDTTLKTNVCAAGKQTGDAIVQWHAGHPRQSTKKNGLRQASRAHDHTWSEICDIYVCCVPCAVCAPAFAVAVSAESAPRVCRPPWPCWRRLQHSGRHVATPAASGKASRCSTAAPAIKSGPC